MLAKYLDINSINIIGREEDTSNLYKIFLNNEEISFAVVVDNQGVPIGIIYRDDLKIMKNSISEYIAKDMIIADPKWNYDRVEKEICDLLKKKIYVILKCDEDGKLRGGVDPKHKECR